MCVGSRRSHSRLQNVRLLSGYPNSLPLILANLRILSEGAARAAEMEPAEVEFLAEKELITIVPNFSENRLYLISVGDLIFTLAPSMFRQLPPPSFGAPQGEVGPFNPSMQTRVPLWLALNLRQRQKCHIVPPEWLSVGE